MSAVVTGPAVDCGSFAIAAFAQDTVLGDADTDDDCGLLDVEGDLLPGGEIGLLIGDTAPG